jgi:hypothetical protein
VVSPVAACDDPPGLRDNSPVIRAEKEPVSAVVRLQAKPGTDVTHVIS